MNISKKLKIKTLVPLGKLRYGTCFYRNTPEGSDTPMMKLNYKSEIPSSTCFVADIASGLVSTLSNSELVQPRTVTAYIEED